MSDKKKNINRLTPSEQKTTAAFKLMDQRNKSLEKSLKNTQDELERYRGKYHESDKSRAIEKSRNSTLFFHEVLKFIISILFGGIGVNLITGKFIGEGIVIVMIGIIFYVVIVLTDKFNK